MVEAAIVMPIVILAIIASIYMMIVMYNDTAQQSRIHYASLVEAGYFTESFLVNPGSNHTYSFNKRSAIYPYIEAKHTYQTTLGGLIKSKHTFGNVDSRAYIINEEEQIRKLDLIFK